MQTQTQDRIPLVVFDGQIKCESPVSFVLHNGLKKKHLQLQPTMRTADGTRLYLNAPAIRSALRHAATEHVIELMGRDVHMDDYFLMALGGIKDAKDAKGGDGGENEEGEQEEDKTESKKAAKQAAESKGSVLKWAFAREKNPLLMLFGSMDVPGSLECGHAIATKDVLAETFGGVRANDFKRDPSLIEKLEPGALDAFVERQMQASQRSAAKKDAKDIDAKILAARKAGNDALAAQLAEQKKALDDTKSAVVQIQQLLEYQAIPAGTALAHDMRVRRVSSLELALFVQAIARWALEPVFPACAGIEGDATPAA